MKTFMNTMWDKGGAVFLLRLLVGFGFAAHGYAKLERGPAHFAAALAGIGVVAPLFMAWLVTLIELLGACC